MTNKQADSDDLAELSEVIFDQSSRNFLEEFLGEIPADFIETIPTGKAILTIGKLYSSAKSYQRTKMLRAFLKGFQSGEKSFDDFSKLDEKSKNDLRSLIITQLDLQTDERQAEAIGLIVDAYIAKKVSQHDFIGIVAEIKNTNPLLYYFSANTLTIDRLHTNFGKPIIKGNTRLLPAIFYMSSMTSNAGGWDTLSTPPSTVTHPTQTGEAFFDYVYEPMLRKYRHD